ncbi:ABC transporter permease [Pseudaeromonas paramecii]|uniref:ABC transporter permease n=1 Tax=Pseudaeromonas paramecii TaxID=2138166 RepID=A0ABP8QFQ6_9GAMM
MPTNRWTAPWRLIGQDRWQLALLLWLPLLLGLWLWSLFGNGLPRDLPIGVLDQDGSHLSRRVSQLLDDSAGLQVTRQFSQWPEAADALRSGRLYGLVILPYEFEKDVRLGKQPVVEARYNGQLLLVGRLVNGSLQQALGTANASLAGLTALAHGVPSPGALGQAAPIRVQITPLFNLSTNYAQFLLSAIWPAIWQILCVLPLLVGLARHQQQTPDWLGRLGLPLLLPYWLIGWGWGALMLLAFQLAGWPLAGSLAMLLLGQGLMVGASLAIGCLLYLLTRDGTRAMSLAAAFSAPALAFIGITFPAEQMNGFASVWRSLLPVSHYVDLQVQQGHYAMTGLAAWLPIRNLLLFGLLWLPVVWIIRRARRG